MLRSEIRMPTASLYRLWNFLPFLPSPKYKVTPRPKEVRPLKVRCPQSLGLGTQGRAAVTPA